MDLIDDPSREFHWLEAWRFPADQRSSGNSLNFVVVRRNTVVLEIIESGTSGPRSQRFSGTIENLNGHCRVYRESSRPGGNFADPGQVTAEIKIGEALGRLSPETSATRRMIPRYPSLLVETCGGEKSVLDSNYKRLRSRYNTSAEFDFHAMVHKSQVLHILLRAIITFSE